MLEVLLKYDHELFYYLNSLGNEQWDGFWLFVTNKFSFIPLYLLLLFLIYKKLGLKHTLMIMLLVGAMITTSDQLANLFKHLFARPRPCQPDIFEEAIRFIAPRCGRYGYFSAHAASSMALAFFVGLLLKKHYRYLLLILVVWSLVVSYSRIYVGVHYPLDIITGMLIGGGIGYLYFLLLNFIVKRFPDTLKPE
jgi:undecaprenyl-diphosphatase